MAGPSPPEQARRKGSPRPAWPYRKLATVAPEVPGRILTTPFRATGPPGQQMVQIRHAGMDIMHGTLPQFTTAWPRPRRQLRTIALRVSLASDAPAAAPVNAPTMAPPIASPSSSASPSIPPIPAPMAAAAIVSWSSCDWLRARLRQAARSLWNCALGAPSRIGSTSAPMSAQAPSRTVRHRGAISIGFMSCLLRLSNVSKGAYTPPPGDGMTAGISGLTCGINRSVLHQPRGRADPGPAAEGPHESRGLRKAQEIGRFPDGDLARAQVIHRHSAAQVVMDLREGDAFVLHPAIERLPAHAEVARDAVHRQRSFVQVREHPRLDSRAHRVTRREVVQKRVRVARKDAEDIVLAAVERLVEPDRIDPERVARRAERDRYPEKLRVAVGMRRRCIAHLQRLLKWMFGRRAAEFRDEPGKARLGRHPAAVAGSMIHQPDCLPVALEREPVPSARDRHIGHEARIAVQLIQTVRE